MAEYKLVLPSMGEGIMEATVVSWLKNIGDYVNEDESVVEVATDKVDSEVPSPVSGVLKEILINVNEVAKVGEAMAIFEVEESVDEETKIENTDVAAIEELEKPIREFEARKSIESSDGFYSPLVKSIADKENISEEELKQIKGSGLGGRITKEDVFNYLKNKQITSKKIESSEVIKQKEQIISQEIIINQGDEIIEMDRMRKIISKNMLESKQTSAHVTSFVETDMTSVVLWREKFKDDFFYKEKEKLTYMPILIQALAKTIKDFPMINVSVQDGKIIKKKNINIGMATALPSGNLIVPVIKNADELSLSGLAKKINDLARRARENSLKPEEIQGGTYTITNIGSFGNILGTPIINQPQVAIMAVGVIAKKPSVVETPQGDLIGIRHKMYLSHTYDHRVIDGALGGMFVKRFSDYLEDFDLNTQL